MADLTISGLRALLDADPDIQSLAVGEGLLRELLDAAAERDEALRRVAELEVALEPHGARRLELAKKLAISASNLLRIERDDARRQVAELETDAVELEDRVAELEGLLVQAEDYARDAADAAAVDTADSTDPGDDEDDDKDDDTYWCTPCQMRIGHESHYHCGNCGQVSSMLGHSNLNGGFDCQPEPAEGPGR